MAERVEPLTGEREERALRLAAWHVVERSGIPDITSAVQSCFARQYACTYRKDGEIYWLQFNGSHIMIEMRAAGERGPRGGLVYRRWMRTYTGRDFLRRARDAETGHQVTMDELIAAAE